MDLFVTAVFYIVMGAIVSVAVLLASERVTTGERWFYAVTSLLYWPLYLPVLLARGVRISPEPKSLESRVTALERLIEQVEQELQSAFTPLRAERASFSNYGEQPFAPLMTAFRRQLAELRELDAVLIQKRKALRPSPEETGPRSLGGDHTQLWEQLQAVRSRKESELCESLHVVREQGTRLQLARFSGVPEAQLHDLIAEIGVAGIEQPRSTSP